LYLLYLQSLYYTNKRDSNQEKYEESQFNQYFCSYYLSCHGHRQRACQRAADQWHDHRRYFGFIPQSFAPTGITFTIWGVIYLLLAAHTLYQLGLFRKKGEEVKTALLKDVGILFGISSLANFGWIFAWHYKVIPLSMVLMLVILVCLALIYIRINKETLTANEKIFIRLPFSVYFGWITVATIANATTLFVDMLGSPVNLLGISEVVWTVVILLVGL